jgi:hypothetical protein
LACFITDLSGLRNREQIGTEIIAWECDFPHSDSNWPKAPEMLMEEFATANVSDSEINAITFENSCRTFWHEPFKSIDRTEATVGALRAQALDVDTKTTPRAEWRRRFAERTGTELRIRSIDTSVRHPNSDESGVA